jgi:hypothetical protein
VNDLGESISILITGWLSNSKKRNVSNRWSPPHFLDDAVILVEQFATSLNGDVAVWMEIKLEVVPANADLNEFFSLQGLEVFEVCGFEAVHNPGREL